MTVAYELGENLYLNLTNRCNNNCQFCVRNFKDGVADYNLWLEEEPSIKTVIKELKSFNLDSYQEIIFCGYGEPLIRFKAVIEIAKYIKNNSRTLIRVNTNGQANLIHQKNILPFLSEVIDKISISLNASNAQMYKEICQPVAGQEAFQAVISFIKEARKYISEVVASVVNYPGVNVSQCQNIAQELEVDFKLRNFA